MLDQPRDERGGLVAAQIVQDQEQPQRRQPCRQGERDGEAGLPPLPRGAALLLGLGWWLRQRRQDGRQLHLEPGVEDRVRSARDTFDPHLSRGWVEQGQQFGGAVADVLMRIAGRAGRRAPTRTGLRDRLIWPRFVPGPDRQLRLPVRVLDQTFFGVASGSWTSTSPCLRRRLASPVWHHVRSRCQLSSASCSTHQMVYVLLWGSPSSARRNARWSVVNDQVAVPSCSRSGAR